MCRGQPTCNCLPPQRGQVSVWPDIEFNPGSRELTAAARGRLDRLIREASGLGIERVRFLGYDDGAAVPDEALALARAQAARDYLVSKGVPESSIDIAIGERATGARPRVEIVLGLYL